MKIAVWHNLPSGGGKRALFNHVRGLVSRGHEVEAWCPPTADRGYLPLADLIPEHVVDLPNAQHGWSDRLRLRLWVESAIEAMHDHCRKCAEEISRGGFDVLFANSSLFFAAAPIGRYVRIPSVIYLGEPTRRIYEASPRLVWSAPPRSSRSRLDPLRWKEALADWRSLASARVRAREELDNASAYTRILVNSLYSRESVLRAYGLDCDVCYLGVDTEKFIDLGLERENFIVGLGSFVYEKNLRLCIEAVGALAPPRPRLVWIGNLADEDYFAEIKALAQSLQVAFEPRMKVSETELLNTLNQASAMVYAPRLEPFGLAPLEGNACGLPVIAVAEGGVRETISDGVNGLLVEHNPTAVAAAIDRLLKNPTLARRLGAAARRQVEAKWGLEAGIDRLERALACYAAK